MDAVILQRFLHGIATSGAWYFGSIHICTSPGQIPPAVHDGPAKPLLQAQGIRPMDRQRRVPLSGSVRVLRAHLVW